MKYNKTIQKIKASEELKQETIDKLLLSGNKAVENQYEIKKEKHFKRGFAKIATAVSMAVVLGFCAVFFPIYYGASNNSDVYNAKRSEIIKEIKKYRNSRNLQKNENIEGSVPESPSLSEDSSGDYAKTNVQIEGIDEGDIIKVDDNYIYKLSSAGLVIVSVQNEMKISCKIDYENFVPIELFVFNNKLIVIGGVYKQYNYSGSKSMGAAIDCCYVPYQDTKVIIYNLNDKINLIKLEEYNISGSFLTSRLIDNKLIFTVDYYFNIYDEKTYFPKINSKEIEAEKIYIYNMKQYYNYIITASIDLNNSKIDYSAHLGLYGTAYFSKDYIYFFNADYSGVIYNYQFQRGIAATKIFKISLKDLQCAAIGKIDGVVDDRYYADEYEDNLRVVSYVYYWENSSDKSYSNVYVLDKNLKEIGKISKIAVSERIYSVRFNKDKGSIVTFRNIDPLFKLDLLDPFNPKISDGLKEEGVNTYLQYLSNNMILGLGMNAVTEGDRTYFKGMKISLYDNSGANAVNIKTIDIGQGYVYSEALYNPKAILNDTAKNMLSFAVDMWDYDINGYGYSGVSQQGLAVFKYDLTNENNEDKLIFRGILSNIEGNANYGNWYDYYDSYHSFVLRGARIGGKIYTISDKYITSYDLETLQLIQRLQIAEFKSAAELFGM